MDRLREKTGSNGSPRVNLRPLLFCALGLIFGELIYHAIRFHTLSAANFILFAAVLLLSAFPLSVRRFAIVFLAFCLFAATGVFAAHIAYKSYISGAAEGYYTVTGTVSAFAERSGYTEVVLKDLTFDGAKKSGKLSATVSEEGVRPGDVITFSAQIRRVELTGDGNSDYNYSENIKYTAGTVALQKLGTKNLFLKLRGRLYDTLAVMGRTEGAVAYALLTGDSHSMDAGLISEVRRGGIAHIFAVSGLHIGILYGAVALLTRPLKRYNFLPAFGMAFLYTAFCGFTVSSVRALIMCGILGGSRAIGAKYDLLASLSAAAVLILLIAPRRIMSVGFRLSFGAVAGLALFSGQFSRLLQHIPHFPEFLRSYLAANLSVQIFTLPILFTAFGYFSVWSFVLNFFLLPVLPVLFLFTLLTALVSLVIPPAAFVLLAPSKGMFGLMLTVLAYGDFAYAISGFSLGAGAGIWLVGCVLLSERVRLSHLLRTAAATLLSLLFALSLIAENIAFRGCNVFIYAGGGHAVLLECGNTTALVIDGEISAASCEDFLLRRYGGKLDAVVTLGEGPAIGRAASLDPEEIYAREYVETGLRREVRYLREFSVGAIEFTYESETRVGIAAEGVLLSFDCADDGKHYADLALFTAPASHYTLYRGRIYRR